jgi:hypothetical protein
MSKYFRAMLQTRKFGSFHFHAAMCPTAAEFVCRYAPNYHLITFERTTKLRIKAHRKVWTSFMESLPNEQGLRVTTTSNETYSQCDQAGVRISSCLLHRRECNLPKRIAPTLEPAPTLASNNRLLICRCSYRLFQRSIYARWSISQHHIVELTVEPNIGLIGQLRSSKSFPVVCSMALYVIFEFVLLLSSQSTSHKLFLRLQSTELMHVLCLATWQLR